MRDVSEHSWTVPANTWLCTKKPSFPQSLMHDGILHQKAFFHFLLTGSNDSARTVVLEVKTRLGRGGFL
jgi:hypothetical protein